MIIDYDVIVLGSGIAGLSFALRVSEFASVAVITKKSDSTSNTNNAQGGIAAVMAASDTFEAHIRDTLTAGAGLCDEAAVTVLVTEGPERIRELMELGVNFTKSSTADPDNPLNLDLGREGGHSARRIVHAADLTGREVERALVRRVKANHNIHVFEHHQATELLTDKEGSDTVVCGCRVLDTETGDIDTFRSRIVMLSTGGLCQTYKHTTNPSIATGDGVAMAYDAGAVIANLEFIQFHPTSLFHPEANSFLISEAVRGEGGILRLPDGTRFMPMYHELKELAPRDIVARAIHHELMTKELDCVYLDITHRDPEFVKNHFPFIYKNCLAYGIDITRQPIPTVPAAHYSCGGVRTDLNAQTSIRNMYACGEVSCTGVHGANRLASNSLLEAVVFSKRAADHARGIIGDIELRKVEDLGDGAAGKRSHTDEIDLVKKGIKNTMWKYVGIVRTNEWLEKALSSLKRFEDEYLSIKEDSRVTSQLVELASMVTCARLITQSALERKESRGLNYNLDYPDRDDRHIRDTVIQKEIR
ncbi:MAG: L-aspartate oxidase [Abditibacteriota bacterium]|nr:L-aspartate oxidase [Abditibacteriota bacterium]